MRFDNGMLGMCITIVAIMGMVLAGFALSVQQSERVVTGYDYVTDVSGLFDYSDDPQYVAYNPSANWTGFSTSDDGITGGIDYDTSESANSYPIIQENTAIKSETADLSGLNLTQLSPPVYDGPNDGLHPWGVVFDKDPPTSGAAVFDVPRPSVATLSTLIGALNIEGASVYTITLGTNQDSPIVIPNSGWSYRTHTAPISPTLYIYTASYYRDASATTSITIEVESGIATGYTASGTIAWRESAANMCIVYGGQAVSGSPTTWNLETSLAYSAYSTPDPIYMNTLSGVTLNASPVQWSNGYPVGGMDILFRVPSVGTPYINTLSIPLTDGPDGPGTGTLEVYIGVSTSGRVQVTVSGGSAEQTIDIGQWRNFLLSLDFVDGSYSVVPVTRFATFADYTAMEDARIFDRVTLSGTAEVVTWGYTADSLTFGVVGTDVFMNTYGVVMTDPSLSISEYFPEMADMRLNFYSFALYGQSITVNGQTFTVDDGGRIIVPGDSEPHTLTNIYITFEDNTYLTFLNDGYTADLGPTTTDLVEFAGNWYFTTGLYEGYETVESYYEWTVDTFIFNSDGAVIVFLGLLALGTAVGAKFVGIRTLDIVVVVCAGLFGYVMLGAFT